MRKPSYKQILNRLALPKDTPQTLPCKMCGKTLHQIRVNRYTAFWIHKPEDVETCSKANKIFHKPVIATSQSWTGQRVTEIWNELVQCNATAKNKQ